MWPRSLQRLGLCRGKLVKTILITAPLGRCVKNLLYTEVFAQLRMRYRVCIVSPAARFPEFVKEFSDENTAVYDQPYFEGRWRRLFWRFVFEPVRNFSFMWRWRSGLMGWYWNYEKARSPMRFRLKVGMYFASLAIGGFAGLSRISTPWLFRHSYYEKVLEKEKPSLVISTACMSKSTP
jgi:hypothetical protein